MQYGGLHTPLPKFVWVQYITITKITNKSLYLNRCSEVKTCIFHSAFAVLIVYTEIIQISLKGHISSKNHVNPGNTYIYYSYMRCILQLSSERLISIRYSIYFINVSSFMYWISSRYTIKCEADVTAQSCAGCTIHKYSISVVC